MGDLGMELWRRVLEKTEPARLARIENAAWQISNGRSTPTERKPGQNPTPEQRARPGYPNHTFEDTDECPNCLGAGFLVRYEKGWHPVEVQCVVCSGQKAVESREKYSGLPELVKGYKLYDPNLVHNGYHALMAAIGFGQEEVGEFFLTLAGNNGTGKSHLLMAMAQDVLNAGFAIKYLYAPAFLDELRKTFNRKDGDVKHTYDSVFEGYKRPYLLVLDDLGRGHYSEWGVAQMELLIEYRYRNQMKTAFATNYDPTELAEKLGLMVADRVYDFGSGAALVVHIGGPSYRTKGQW